MPKTKFDQKDGCKYALMHMIFDVKQKDLRHKAGLVVGIHVVDFKDYTTYPYTIKDASLRLMLLIYVKNWLGIMSRYIGNSLFTAPCAQKI